MCTTYNVCAARDLKWAPPPAVVRLTIGSGSIHYVGSTGALFFPLRFFSVFNSRRIHLVALGRVGKTTDRRSRFFSFFSERGFTNEIFIDIFAWACSIPIAMCTMYEVFHHTLLTWPQWKVFRTRRWHYSNILFLLSLENTLSYRPSSSTLKHTTGKRTFFSYRLCNYDILKWQKCSP